MTGSLEVACHTIFLVAGGAILGLNDLSFSPYSEVVFGQIGDMSSHRISILATVTSLSAFSMSKPSPNFGNSF